MQSGVDVPFWQEFYVKFYQTFIEANRWQQFLKGTGSTLMVTALALLIGVLLGVIVAIIRSAHDQQRPGKKNILLGFFNKICKVYVTVIRGTPMLVQLLIMGFVIFKSSRSYTAIGILTLGINSGAYVAEIIRGGLMSLDPGQAEAGRSLGLTYVDTMRFLVIPQAFKAILPSLGNEFITLIKETAIVGYVGLMDIQKAGDFIKSATYEAFMPLIGIAVIYFVLIKLLTLLLGIIEKQLRKSDIR